MAGSPGRRGPASITPRARQLHEQYCGGAVAKRPLERMRYRTVAVAARSHQRERGTRDMAAWAFALLSLVGHADHRCVQREAVAGLGEWPGCLQHGPCDTGDLPTSTARGQARCASNQSLNRSAPRPMRPVVTRCLGSDEPIRVGGGWVPGASTGVPPGSDQPMCLIRLTRFLRDQADRLVRPRLRHPGSATPGPPPRLR